MKTIIWITPLLAGVLALAACKSVKKTEQEEAVSNEYKVTAEDDAFLEDLERRCYRFFEDSADPKTGLIADRWQTDGKQEWRISSIASTGFGLTAHAIASERGWISREEGLDRCWRTLIFFRDRVDHKNGFFYQYISRDSGDREPGSPASTIDNALLLAGAMTAAQTFPDSDLPGIVDALYRRMNWKWMLSENGFLRHGWKPEVGFLTAEWKSYSELMLLVLLAVGAEEHAIPASCWDTWKRGPVLEFKGEKFACYPPLFIHQYTQAYFDFRNYQDEHLDYWRNSQVATLAQIDYMERLSEKFPDELAHYGQDLWGLTASDGPDGYKDWGAPFTDPRLKPWRDIDGTLVPSAPGGSLAICPAESLHTLQFQKKKYGKAVYGRYGFTNAYNPRTGWIDRYCIGIDTGITLLMAENLRSEFVWKKFMSHPAAQRAFERANFKPKKN